ncbi:MAG: hypothetical protein IK024_13990 [Treponema sp.]|nr:hypothetical protein [Treponema sp.]
MLEYEIKINEKTFKNESKDNSDFEYDKLDYLLDLAPVCLLYKHSLVIEKINDEILSDYAKLSYVGTTVLHILDWVSNYSDESFSQSISFYRDKNQINNLTLFSNLIQDLLADFSEHNTNSFLEKIEMIDIKCFHQKIIRNNLYAIIGFTQLIKQQHNFNIKSFNELKLFVEDCFMHIYKYLNKQNVYSIFSNINTLLKCNCTTKQICQIVISSGNQQSKIQHKIEDTCQYALAEILRVLSQKPATQNMNLLKDMIEQYCNLIYSDTLKNFRKNEHRCCAILEKNGDIYFSFSGCKDCANSKGTIINQELQKFITEVNNNLFYGKAKYCYFSDSVKRYIDEIDTGYALLPSSIEYKDEKKNKDLYSCCERKILGLYPNLTQFNMFVFFSPCNRCLPALYQQYTTIHSFVTYKRPVNYISVTDFSQKEYEIVLEKGIFLCKHTNP